MKKIRLTRKPGWKWCATGAGNMNKKEVAAWEAKKVTGITALKEESGMKA
jgi:hypothetical protein